MADTPKDPIEWINASNDKALKKHGITCGRDRIDDGMKALHGREIQLRMSEGQEPPAARRAVEADFIREDYNRAGHPVWQINRTYVDRLAHWIDDQYHWISATNTERMGESGITESRERIDEELAAMSRDEIASRKPHMGDIKARLEVSGAIVRKGETEQGNPVWQIHDSAIPSLRQRLDTPSPWINSHNRTELSTLGITRKSVDVDAALEGYYDQLVMRTGMREGKGIAAARAQVDETMLRRGETAYGIASWDIRRTYLPTLIKEVPSLLPRKEADWMSATSHRLKARAEPFGGLGGRRESVEHAMETLHDQLIEERVAGGMREGKARNKVREECVKPSEGQGGLATWKIYDDPNLIRQLVEVKNALYPPRGKQGQRSAGRGGAGD